jgi:hypothetical protein
MAEVLESVEGLVAATVGGVDLREDEAQGDPGEIDALPPLMTESAAGRLDGASGEDRQEGEALAPRELITGADELGAEWMR